MAAATETNEFWSCRKFSKELKLFMFTFLSVCYIQLPTFKFSTAFATSVLGQWRLGGWSFPVISCHFLAFPDISWHHQQCECIIGTVCGLPELSNHISNGLSRSHGFQWHTFLLEVEVAALHCIAERQYLPNTRSSILSLRALLSYIQGVFFSLVPPLKVQSTKS